MEKRGVSIFVFTIMFTIIAGAIILVFFFSFGKDLLGFSEKLTKTENILVLEKNLASFALASNSEKVIQFSEDSKIRIECDNTDKKIYLKIPKNEKDKRETKKLIFVPFDIEGKSVQAWTLAWNYPFKIDNLYFVADQNTRFYFVNPTGDLPKYFFDKFPKRFNPQKVTALPNFLDKTVLVYFDSNPPANLPNNVKTVQFIGLDSENPKVKFKQGNELPVWGDTMVYAAIFSADYDQFNCIIKGLAKQRISNIVEIYQDTLGRLEKAEGCDSSYNFEEQLKILSTTQSIDAAKNIKTDNEALKTTNCPVLYKGTETTRLLI